jgi:hypothetical protein
MQRSQGKWHKEQKNREANRLFGGGRAAMNELEF